MRICRLSMTCELSGVPSDSQFCETKNVKAPLGVRDVRLHVESTRLAIFGAASGGDAAAPENKLGGSMTL